MPPQTSNGTDARYTIAAASKLTGVSCHALRAWERRYGFPVPTRSLSGHRRYDTYQIERLRWAASQVHAGLPIGEVLSGLPPKPTGVAAPSPTDLPSPYSGLSQALMAGDLNAAEAVYEQLSQGIDHVEQITQIIEPLLVDIGEDWFRGRCQIYQERCASGFLRRKLMLMLDQAQAANPSPPELALIGTPQGDRHEGGTLILAVLLELAGWRAVPLGTDLPSDEYQKAIDLWEPTAICVSFVMSRNVRRRFAELASLQGAPVFVGGRSLVNYQGLARRFGLKPLLGSAVDVVPALIRQTLPRAAHPTAHRS